MYKPRTMPVLTGETAERVNDWVRNNSFPITNDIDYSAYAKAWEEIDKRCEKAI